MTLVDWLQIASIALVAAALILSGLQMRHVAQQTREAGRQAAAATTALGQTAYQQMLASQAEYRAFYLNSPSTIEWYLASRGYEVGTAESNKRSLYVLVRLNSHESCFLGKRGGLLDDDVWVGWLNVIKVDFEIPEFRAVWPHAKQFYARSFAAFIDDEIIAHIANATTPHQPSRTTTNDAQA